MSLQQISIAGSSAGLHLDKKPFLQPDQAFVQLENAYVFRDRVVKRQGLEIVGRLRRALTLQNLGNTDGSGNFSGNIITILTLETNAQIEPGSITITVGLQVFTEPATPDGTLSNGGSGTGTINYTTGDLTIDTDPDLAATAVIISFSYFPSLPVMGIFQRDISDINQEQTIWFDTVYAYEFTGGGFSELAPGTVWSGTDADFFWCTNYRGATPESRLFFATNFICTAANPIRYFNGAAWTDFAPLVSATDTLFQARILIPYYGRLVALNVFEGTTAGGYGAAVQIYNRCRFSQLGSPIAADAWRTDIFGKGGFIDAPVDEEIIGATFFKNTLIVTFERSTWQLRYVGEYGLPFIWERISSDFGSESTFSSILFDEGVITVGDRAIVSSSGVNVNRIDLQIPDIVFLFRNADNGVKRVHGIRDFQRELVYWCFSEFDSQEIGQYFPNKVLVYNYRNNTYAIFRDNVTAFGTFQPSTSITWSSTDILWEDEDVFWSDPDAQSGFPVVVIGNAEGYVHRYGYTTPDDASLSISAIDLTVTPIEITIINHNLSTGDIIFLDNCLFTPDDPLINGRIFQVTFVDLDTISLSEWTGTNYADVSSTTITTYLGNGDIALFPRMSMQTKDFNPFDAQGMQTKISYIDFLTDATPSSSVNVALYLNSSVSVQGNLIVGNIQNETTLNLAGIITAATQANPCVITCTNHGLRTGQEIMITNVQGMTQINNLTFTVTYINSSTFSIGVDSTAYGAYLRGGNWVTVLTNYYLPGQDYSWHRFFATSTGQFIRIAIGYDDALMNDISTHQQAFTLNAIKLWVRPGSKNIF